MADKADQAAETASVSSGPTVRRRFGASLLGLLLTLAATPAYLLLVDVPILRSTGLVAYVFMAAGLGLGLWAAFGDRRWRTRLPSAVNAVLVALTVYMFVWAFRLPSGGSVATSLSTVTDFTLPDQTGKPVALQSRYERGPILLVFYRGHW